MALLLIAAKIWAVALCAFAVVFVSAIAFAGCMVAAQNTIVKLDEWTRP